MRTSLVTRLSGASFLRDRARGFQIFAELHRLRGNVGAVVEAAADLAPIEAELRQFREAVVPIEIARRRAPR